MRALTTRVVTVLAVLGLVVFNPASVLAHDVLYPGTVLTVESARIEIKTIDPDTKKDVQLWFAVDKNTKVKRGEASVKYAEAGIRKGERIVVVVNHDDGGTAAAEIRLATSGQ
jgi:Cu/Ag efflux protein CusF